MFWRSTRSITIDFGRTHQKRRYAISEKSLKKHKRTAADDTLAQFCGCCFEKALAICDVHTLSVSALQAEHKASWADVEAAYDAALEGLMR